MAVVFQIFDEFGRLIVDQNTLIFRILGTRRIVGDTSGDPNLAGGSGTIVDELNDFVSKRCDEVKDQWAAQH